jgi:hypothetical protein
MGRSLRVSHERVSTGGVWLANWPPAIFNAPYPKALSFLGSGIRAGKRWTEHAKYSRGSFKLGKEPSLLNSQFSILLNLRSIFGLRLWSLVSPLNLPLAIQLSDCLSQQNNFSFQSLLECSCNFRTLSLGSADLTCVRLKQDVSYLTWRFATPELRRFICPLPSVYLQRQLKIAAFMFHLFSLQIKSFQYAESFLHSDGRCSAVLAKRMKVA